jgi:hypothetical protein
MDLKGEQNKMEMDTQAGINETLEGHMSRRTYETEVKPLISEKKYFEAINYLENNPEVENYLCVSEWRELFKYSQSQLEATLKAWTETEKATVEGVC